MVGIAGTYGGKAPPVDEEERVMIAPGVKKLREALQEILAVEWDYCEDCKCSAASKMTKIAFRALNPT